MTAPDMDFGLSLQQRLLLFVGCYVVVAGCLKVQALSVKDAALHAKVLIT